MIESKSSPRPGENVWLWLVKIITGPLIIIVLAIHFLINHLLAPEGLLTWSEVVAYYQNPLVIIMEAAFLLFVISHSLIGTRGIILDLNPNRAVMRVLDIAFVILGSAATIYGIWLLFAVASQGG